jgi:hypothetical protein
LDAGGKHAGGVGTTVQSALVTPQLLARRAVAKGQLKELVLGLANRAQLYSRICAHGSAGRGPVKKLADTRKVVNLTHAVTVAGMTPSMALPATQKSLMSTQAPMLSGRLPFRPLCGKRLQGG